MSTLTPTNSVNSWALYKRLWSYTKPYRWSMWIAVFAMLLTAATEPAVPALMEPLLNKGFTSGGPTFSWWVVPACIIGLFVVRGIGTFVSAYATSWISANVQTDLRMAMFSHLMRLPASHFQKESHAVIASRLVFDVSNIGDSVGRALIVLVRDTATVIGLLAWLLWLNWKLTFAVLLLVPTIGTAIAIFSRRYRRISRSLLEQTGELSRVANEASIAYKPVKVYGAYERQNRVFFNVANRWRGTIMKISTATALATPITQLFASIALAVVVSLAIQQSTSGQTSVGSFVSFITAMLMLFTPLKHLADVNATFQRGLASAESVFALLDLPPESDEGKAQLSNCRGAISFHQVDFRYPEASSDALKKVSFQVNPGEIVALVGVSGAGKTSVMNLLPRFYAPTHGHIAIDGVDIAQVSLRSLRAQIALVSQEIVLFNDTLAANVAFGLPDGVQVSEQELWQALDHAALGDWVRQQPLGLEMMIGEGGSQLSGGQRQRLAIARALVKNAPILLLDEATSALDTETEKEVQAAIEAGVYGNTKRTTLIIAHRLSTIANADRVLVFEQGCLVEEGSPAVLREKGGSYARLVQAAGR